mmetsp:Transcript_89911/g.232176  ORF Transcript_89911/g.232176 Transcript_89911/m.232176 type:complete len:256 (-) Transcript_89911:408-1175(-)
MKLYFSPSFKPLTICPMSWVSRWMRCFGHRKCSSRRRCNTSSESSIDLHHASSDGIGSAATFVQLDKLGSVTVLSGGTGARRSTPSASNRGSLLSSPGDMRVVGLEETSDEARIGDFGVTHDVVADGGGDASARPGSDIMQRCGDFISMIMLGTGDPVCGFVSEAAVAEMVACLSSEVELALAGMLPLDSVSGGTTPPAGACNDLSSPTPFQTMPPGCNPLVALTGDIAVRGLAPAADTSPCARVGEKLTLWGHA